MSKESLQTAEKGREVKGKGEKERYIHLNAEFQRIARRDKKAFLSDQCREIEENNRMGKTRDVFKILEIPREHFMKRWAQNKGQNDMDPTEEDDIRRGVKNTQKNCTKKMFMTQINEGLITHLEPDFLECEVKWALGSITMNKASGGDGIPGELFQNSSS